MILFAENLVPHQLFFAVLVAFSQIRGLVSKKWVISHGLLYTKWEYFALETCLASNANSQSWRWHTFKDKKGLFFSSAYPCNSLCCKQHNLSQDPDMVCHYTLEGGCCTSALSESDLPHIPGNRPHQECLSNCPTVHQL